MYNNLSWRLIGGIKFTHTDNLNTMFLKLNGFANTFRILFTRIAIPSFTKLSVSVSLFNLNDSFTNEALKI